MNNKGFAITSIIYGLMLLFVVIVTSFLSILVGKNRRFDELVEGVYDSLEYETIEVTINETKNDFKENENTTYVTKKRALYNFKINNKECLVYLPRSVILITGAYKEPGNDDIKNKLYYYYQKDNSEETKNEAKDLKNYKELTNNCINK